jgi:hypothetical protein
MRGVDQQQSGMFSYISAERRVPKDHPLRAIRIMVDAALKESSWRFDAVYASSGLGRRFRRRSFCARCYCKCFTRCAASGC